MFYKVPCPTKTNGVRLFKVGDQIAVEYQRGEPSVGKMAYDSALGSMARDVTIRPKAKRKVGYDEPLRRPFMSREKDMQEPLEAQNISRGGPRGEDEDDDDTYADPQEVAGKVISYLKDLISPEDLEAVNGLLMGTESDDAHEGRRQAADRARDRGLAGRLARQQANDAEFAKMFPDALKILRR